MADQEMSLPDAPLTGLPERFQPRNLTELMAWSKLVGSSGLAPKGMNEAGIVICVQMGAELGITPTQALQNIAVINGRPSIFGDLGLALFKKHAPVDSFEESGPAQALKEGKGTCSIHLNDGTTVERTFSIDDAKGAGLWGKPGPWSAYPGRMLQMRARWFAMRDAAPGVFKGVSSREESDDIVPVESTVDGVTMKAPKRRSGAPPAAQIEAFVSEMGKPAPSPATGNVAHPAAIVAAPAPQKPQIGGIKVLIDDATKREGGGKTFYTVDYTSSSVKGSVSTFSETDFATALSLKGNFAFITLKDSKKMDPKTGQPYKNLASIAPAPEDDDASPEAGE